MSESILEAVVEFWVRHSLRDRHPQHHEICYQHFDFVMAKLWKKAQASKIPRQSWIVAKSDALSVFMDVDKAFGH